MKTTIVLASLLLLAACSENPVNVKQPTTVMIDNQPALADSIGFYTSVFWCQTPIRQIIVEVRGEKVVINLQPMAR